MKQRYFMSLLMVLLALTLMANLGCTSKGDDDDDNDNDTTDDDDDDNDDNDTTDDDDNDDNDDNDTTDDDNDTTDDDNDTTDDDDDDNDDNDDNDDVTVLVGFQYAGTDGAAANIDDITISGLTTSKKADVLVTEDFEAGTWPPTNWTVVVNDTGDPTFTWDSDAASYHAGAYSAGIYYDSDLNPQDEWFISPPINLAGYDSLEVDFWISASVTWSSPPTENYHVIVNISTDDGVTWEPIYSFPEVDDVTDWIWYNHIKTWTPAK